MAPPARAHYSIIHSFIHCCRRRSFPEEYSNVLLPSCLPMKWDAPSGQMLLLLRLTSWPDGGGARGRGGEGREASGEKLIASTAKPHHHHHHHHSHYQHHHTQCGSGWWHRQQHPSELARMWSCWGGEQWDGMDGRQMGWKGM